MITRRQLLVASLPCWAFHRACGSAPAVERNSKPYLISADEAQKLIGRLRPLHEKKRPVKPGDWLEKHKESGQSFEAYLKSHPTRVCERYRALYLQPLGKFSDSERQVLTWTSHCLERFFGLPVTINQIVSLDNLPERARRVHPDWKIPQVLSTHLLDQVLKPRSPKDAAAFLGLTSSDLWPGEGWNFVFGQASLQDRVGVWSVYRNGKSDGTEEERRMFLRRTLKTALHETGHMFGILHCTAYECGMNGSNHRQESDSQPLEFCPECQPKIWWTCGVRPTKRTEQLLAFAQERGLTEEAASWRRTLKELAGQENSD